jgi:predicted HTH transcriptional regulator
MEKIMTNREFYNAITNGTINDEVIAHATAALEKLDGANEKRRNTPSKTAIENQPLVDEIVTSILSREPKTATDVATVLGVSVQKASALLRTIVADGQATATDVKVPKRGTQRAYSVIADSAIAD